jgi:hypothetical protein
MHVATEFGDSVLHAINEGLNELRQRASIALAETYLQGLPILHERSSEEIIGAVNIMTPVDALYLPKGDDDWRSGSVADQSRRIERERQPHQMILGPTK